MPQKKPLFFIAIIIYANLIIADKMWSQTTEEALAKPRGNEINNSSAATDKPNTHKEFECILCHAKTPSPKVNRRDAKLIEGVKSSLDLCNQCHGEFNLHPVNIDPDIYAPDMLIPKVFPLGLAGDTKGKIICITCHDVHLEGSLNLLLRGLPGKTGEEGVFEDRIAMCTACHGKELLEKNPHTQSARTCRYCHLTDPSRMTKAEVTYRSDLLKLCEFCHDPAGEEHFKRANPFRDTKLQFLIPDLKLPLIQGQVNCLTCHNPHSTGERPNFLREKFIRFAEKSRLTNPHDTGEFCLSCHNIDPRTTPQVTYKFEGSFIKLCNWCHATEEATADIHPVNMAPENIKVNEKIFPLQNGEVGCITCHDHRCEQKDINEEVLETNPRFLRGGPYSNRSAICYQCHPKSPRFDVHDQINDEGEIVMKTCSYCHLSTPTDSEMEDDGFLTEPQFTTKMTHLCTRCHQDSPHPANFLHIIKPPEEIRKNIVIFQIENNIKIPLDKAGFVTCVSCHNPHERGIINNLADTYGADEINRKRLKFICLACHAGQAGSRSKSDY